MSQDMTPGASVALASIELELASGVLEYLREMILNAMPEGTGDEQIAATARRVLTTAYQGLGEPPRRSRFFDEISPMLGPFLSALGDTLTPPHPPAVTTVAPGPYPRAVPSEPMVTPPPGNDDNGAR